MLGRENSWNRAGRESGLGEVFKASVLLVECLVDAGAGINGSHSEAAFDFSERSDDGSDVGHSRRRVQETLLMDKPINKTLGPLDPDIVRREVLPGLGQEIHHIQLITSGEDCGGTSVDSAG